MKLSPFYIIICCLALYGFNRLPAQSNSLRLGLGGSSYWYQGDLTQENQTFLRLVPGADFSVNFRANRRIQPTLRAGFGKITEQDDLSNYLPSEDITPNRFVETSFFYADFQLRWLIVRQGWFHPYLIGGLGIFAFNPIDQDGNFLVENIFTRPENELYNTNRLTFPVGIGGIVDISPTFSMGLGYQRRFNTGDYLDNISQWGTVAGPDALHAVQLTAYWQIGTTNQAPVEPAPTPEEPSEPLLAATETPDPQANSKVVPDQLAPIPIDQPDISKRQAYLNDAALTYTQETAPDSIALSEPGFAYTGTRGNPPPSRTDLYGWIQLNQAMSWDACADYLQIGQTLLKALNPGIEGPLPAGQRLKVPIFVLDHVKMLEKP